ncbi:MAG TPA: rRNA maturation RNase YbeY [Xanthobacteraceae bacterium]|nr:rRNA maturation RNase YbeY [Xanthobacteraceae bacterium]
MSRSPLRRPALAVDIVVESPLWKAQRGADAMLRRALAAAAAAVPSEGELAVVLTDDAAIRALNRDWRGEDAATNVLSFPAKEARHDRRAPRLLGDIVMAYETVAREAAAEGKPFMHHLAHLAVHGFLHLVGYDHEANEGADAMEALEIAILARLDVPDPYLLRDQV